MSLVRMLKDTPFLYASGVEFKENYIFKTFYMFVK